MNAGEWVKEVNTMLVRMDEQFAQAKQAFGIKPDLEKARECVNNAGATIMELATVFDQMQLLGFRPPPDVIQRVRSCYADFHRLAIDIDECEHIVYVRSLNASKQSPMN